MNIVRDSVQKLKSMIHQVKAKDLQHSIDVYTACLYSECFRFKEKNGEISERQFSKIEEEVQDMKFKQQQEILQNNANGQLIHLLGSLYRVERDEGLVKASRVAFENEVDARGGVLPGSSRSLPSFDSIRNAVLLKALRDRIGFTLSQRPSSLAGAGNGLFLEGTTDAGRILTLYPGQVYVPEHFAHPGLLESLLVDDHNMCVISRVDGVVVDGQPLAGMENHPYAQGQLVNHPPAGTMPNVIAVPYSLPTAGGSDTPLEDMEVEVTSDASAFPDHLRALFPNRLWRELSALQRVRHFGVVAPTIALMSVRPISDGEELFLNYRLNPKSKQPPDWYAPVDLEEDKRRWFH